MRGYQGDGNWYGPVADLRERLAILESSSIHSQQDRAEMRRRMERVESWIIHLRERAQQHSPSPPPAPEPPPPPPPAVGHTIIGMLAKIDPLKAASWIATMILLVGSLFGYVNPFLAKLAGIP